MYMVWGQRMRRGRGTAPFCFLVFWFFGVLVGRSRHVHPLFLARRRHCPEVVDLRAAREAFGHAGVRQTNMRATGMLRIPVALLTERVPRIKVAEPAGLARSVTTSDLRAFLGPLILSGVALLGYTLMRIDPFAVCIVASVRFFVAVCRIEILGPVARVLRGLQVVPPPHMITE